MMINKLIINRVSISTIYQVCNVLISTPLFSPHSWGEIWELLRKIFTIFSYREKSRYRALPSSSLLRHLSEYSRTGCGKPSAQKICILANPLAHTRCARAHSVYAKQIFFARAVGVLRTIIPASLRMISNFFQKIINFSKKFDMKIEQIIDDIKDFMQKYDFAMEMRIITDKGSIHVSNPVMTEKKKEELQREIEFHTQDVIRKEVKK